MAQLQTGLNTVIKQVVGGVSTPFYPITAAENVVDTEGRDLETRLASIDHQSVPDYSSETANDLRYLRNDNTWHTIPDADVSGTKGVTTLSSATDSTSATTAATSAAVKAVNDALDTFVNTTAPATYLAATLKGANNGLAELDANGQVPSAQLPSFVDDVIEIAAMKEDYTEAYKDAGKTQVVTPEAGKIYILTTDNSTFRWSGTQYAPVRGDLVLGETSTTAYRGDRGKIAYDHSQAEHARVDATKVESSETNGYIKVDGTETLVYAHPGTGTNPHGTTAADVGLGNVGNFKALSTVANQGLTTAEQEAAAANLGVSAGATNTTASAAYVTGLQVATVTVDGSATAIKVPEAVAPDTAQSIEAQSGLMTGAEKAKLAGISAQANKVDVTAIANEGFKVAEVVVDGDTANKIELFAPYYEEATESSAGLMSAADKTKLDGIAGSATEGSASAVFSAGLKIATVENVSYDGSTSSTDSVDIFVPAATTSAAGTMSAADKAKLDNCMQTEVVAKNGTASITDGIIFQIV